MFKEAINNYLHTHGYESIDLKAVLFDMDGVLFDSMPNHAESWHKIMKRFGFGLSREEAYMHEGRTGASTINIVSRRERIIRKSKFPPNPERSVQISGKRTKRSVQKIGCTQHL